MDERVKPTFLALQRISGDKSVMDVSLGSAMKVFKSVVENFCVIMKRKLVKGHL